MVLRSALLLPVLVLNASAQAPPAPKPAMPAPPEDLLTPPAEASASGLRSRVLVPGQGGARTRPDGLVLVRFSGWTMDGKAFAHTPQSEAPAYVLMANLMPGMREALLAMTAGERRRLWVPEAMAFAGMKGRPAGPVVMDLELVESQDHPSRAPEDVVAAPSDAQLLPSGLAFKVLRPGKGTVKPARSNWVFVHYTGWTTDGKMFDSTLLKRNPVLLRLTTVIPGWTEGLQLMVEGERRRFWIPQKLAYAGQSGMPAGMLVFDIELMGISK